LIADGTLLGTLSVDGLLKVWDTHSGAELFSFMTPNNPIIEPSIKAVAFHPAGDLSAIVNGNDIFVVRRSTGRIVATLQFFEVYGLAFSPDGRYLAAGGSDGLVLWSTDSWRPTTAIGRNAGHVLHVLFSPQGTYVATVTSQGDRATVWRTRTGEAVGEMAVDAGGAEVAAFSSDETLFAVSVAGGKRLDPSGGGLKALHPAVLVRNLVTGTPVLRLQHGPSAPSAIAFSADGRYLVTASGTVTAFRSDKVTVKVWRLPDGMEVASLDHSQSVSTIAFTADGRWLVAGGSDPNVWDTGRWERVARLEAQAHNFFPSLSVGGKQVAALTADRSAQVWTLELSDLLASACDRLLRDLTAEEWRIYFGPDDPPHPGCPPRP
jgi:WD40 repeat protein